MRRCIFCGHEIDIVLWVVRDMSECPVPSCRRCAEDRHLSVSGARLGGDAEPTDPVSCRCCGRALPSEGSWPPLVWVYDGCGVMAVCNACRVEYALEAVSPRARRREQGPPEMGTDSSDSPEASAAE